MEFPADFLPECWDSYYQDRIVSISGNFGKTTIGGTATSGSNNTLTDSAAKFSPSTYSGGNNNNN